MLEEILAGGANALGICLSEEALARYRTYYDALSEANRQFNLTAIEGEEQTARLHFLDSLAVLKYAALSGKKVVDVGTGGGLPGLALKLAEPGLDLTLLDATEKKVAFLAELTEKLGLPCVCLCGRAEDLGRRDAYRERYDAAVSRAVARLSVLAELCLPFVKPGGLFLAMKAADSDPEIEEAASATEKLGGRLADIREYAIPGTDIRRRLVIIEKAVPTPAAYPRRWAAIQKRPL